GRDRQDLRIGNGDLGVGGRELEVLLVVLRAVMATREHENQRVVALQLAQATTGLGVVRQLIVGEGPAWRDISAHRVLLFRYLVGSSVAVGWRLSCLIAPVRRPSRCPGSWSPGRPGYPEINGMRRRRELLATPLHQRRHPSRPRGCASHCTELPHLGWRGSRN